jgi:hypothetical protein
MLRGVLRHENLIGTEQREAPPRARTVPPAPDEEARTRRTADGTSQDLSDPPLGSVGTAFGRSARLEGGRPRRTRGR